MVHLIYDFNKFEKEHNWAIIPANKGTQLSDVGHIERNQKFAKTIRAMVLSGITEMKIFDKNTRLSKHTVKPGKHPYIEINFHNWNINIRRITSQTDEWRNDMDKTIGKILAEHFSPLDENPCNKCGKSPHSGYDGLCLDCADEIGVSEHFIHSEQFHENLQRARIYLNTFQMTIGSASFKVGKWDKI